MGARWAAAAFGLGTPARVAPVARGFMGRVWRVDVDAPAPASYAVKELFRGAPDEGAAEAEVAFATACREAGVRGQVSVRSPAGRIVERAPDGVAWRAYEWVEGRVCDEAEVSSWLGRAAATIHAVGAGWAWHESGGDDWYERVDIDWAGLAGRAAAAGLAWAGSLGALTGHLTDLADTVNAVPPGERVVTHRDLMADNVLRAADGGLVLLDWDNTGPLAPWREAGLLVLLRRRDPRAAAQAQTAYLAGGGRDPLAEHGTAALATGLAVLLNALAEQAEVLLSNEAPHGPGQAHLEHAEANVAALLAAVSTCRELDDVLAKVRAIAAP